MEEITIPSDSIFIRLVNKQHTGVTVRSRYCVCCHIYLNPEYVEHNEIITFSSGNSSGRAASSEQHMTEADSKVVLPDTRERRFDIFNHVQASVIPYVD